MAILASQEDIFNALKKYKKVAVIGASQKQERPAFYVPKYLSENGFDIFPVNPVYEGEILFGRKVVKGLAQIAEQIEIVDVFRRSEHLKNELEGILAAKPKLVWLQKGIKDPDFARAITAAGIDLIEDRCMLEEHKRMLKQ